jgi:hypothetical protein
MGLYDFALEKVTTSWSNYVESNSDCGADVKAKFQGTLYGQLGLYCLLITAVSLLLYYFYFNSRFGRYYKNRHWMLFLFLSSLAIFVCTMFIGNAAVKELECKTDQLVYWLALINAFYGAFAFGLLSFLVRLKSPMGRYTPYLPFN